MAVFNKDKKSGILFKNDVSWWMKKLKLRAQSFTSLKANVHQDINGGFVFSRWLNETLP